MDEPEVQNKIKWNIILNEIYDHGKQVVSSNSKAAISDIYNIDGIIKSENLHVTTHQRKQLLNIKETLNRKPEIFTEEKKIRATETIIKTSQLDFSSYNLNNYEVLEVFASDAIVFDSNLDLSGFYGLVSFFAPLWVVKNQAEIRLDGKSPKNINPSKANNLDFCKYNETTPGEDGIPGNPGDTAGSFLGFFETVENGQNLKITAFGSDGGKGQDGGDGPNGCDGQDAIVKDHLWNCYKNVFKWHCDGEHGYPGGNGGDGGAGGKGGLGGDILFYSLQNSSISFEYEAKTGSTGTPGVGGNGGNGGIQGDKGTGVYILGWHSVQTYENTGTETAQAGSKGKDGNASAGIKDPNKTIGADLYIEEVLNDYKDFTEATLEKNDFLRDRNYKLLLKLMSYPNFEQYYTTKGIAREFMDLEEHFYVLNEKIDYLPLYKKLLKHIVTRSKYDTTDEEKKVLTYLYTAILTKICALQEAMTKNFIVELETFLNICIDDINDLKDIETAITIDQTTKTYDDQIDKEINEAEAAVDDLITPKINAAMKKVQTDIKELVSEISRLELEAEIEEAALVEARKALKSSFMTSIIGKSIGMLGSVCSFLGPYGAAASAVTGIISGGLNSISDGINKDINAVVDGYQDLSQKYTGLLNYSQEEVEAKRIILSSKFLELESEAQEFPEILEEINKIRNNIDTFDGSEDELFDIGFNGLDKIKNQIDKISGKDNSKETVKKLIGFNIASLNNAVSEATDAFSVLKDGGTDIYNTVKDYKENVNEISDMIEQNKENIEKIKSLKTSVQNTLTPMLSQMGDTLNALENNLENASSMQLEVENWKIKETLTNVKGTIEEYTAGFEVQNEMVEGINIVMDSMDKMIAVYEKIQSYQNQKKSSDLMAAINSAGTRDIEVKDPELKTILDKLEMYIKSNTLLQKYRQSITQIKQYAFPLAETYFKEVGLPQGIKMEDNIETYTQNAINQIEKFKNKLADSNMYLLEFDNIKVEAEFYDSLPAGPFFVWPNQTHHNSVSKLLAGEEVLFYADPNSQEKNAVKFNMIDIRLKSNSDHQQNLDKILENFQIAMTHSGNHYYNCNNKTYVVNTMSEEFLFDFKNGDDKHVYVDKIYKKIKKGNLVMSPYTSWKIKLSGTREDFETLKTYGEGADLQLVGEGEFYKYEESLCSESMTQYYQLHSAKQQKEDECIKVLTGGKFDKNDPCYVNLDEKTKTFYNPLVLEHKLRRSIGDDIPYYTNDSPRFSSPINNFFKWVNEKIKLLHYQSPTTNTTNFWNPELAFTQMNSLLVLAPLVLHFTLSQEKEEKKTPVEEKLVQVESSTKQMWLDFLEDFQKLSKVYNIKQKWVEMILEDLQEEIESIRKMAREEDLQRVEGNLVTFLVDFLDDVMYDDSFIGIRTNKKFNKALKELTQRATKIRDFEKFFKLSQYSYV